MNKEKARELAEKINSINPSTHITSAMVLNRVEQNQPEHVVVGLRERQINDIALKFLGVNSRVLCPTVGTYSQIISEYLKTQTFTQPNESLIADNLKLAKELEQLKSQPPTPQPTLQPNWDDAPPTAIGAALFLDFYDETAKTVKSVVIKRFEHPQPPAPKVKIGQVWQYKGGSKYQVDSVGRMKFEPHTGWVDCVTFIKLEDSETGAFFTRPLSDFLAKFVRVE